MPKLLIFCPCEQVFISQGDSASLLIIVHELTVQVPPDVPDPFPPKSAVPVKWTIFTQWECGPTDVGVKFEQRCRMAQGDTTVLEIMAEFTPEPNTPLHRMIANLTYFPLGAAGKYRLQAALRRHGEEVWNQQGDYPLVVSYQR